MYYAGMSERCTITSMGREPEGDSVDIGDKVQGAEREMEDMTRCHFRVSVSRQGKKPLARYQTRFFRVPSSVDMEQWKAGFLSIPCLRFNDARLDRRHSEKDHSEREE